MKVGENEEGMEIFITWPGPWLAVAAHLHVQVVSVEVTV